MKKYKILAEVLVACAVIGAFYLAYHYEEDNFDILLAKAFPSSAMSLGKVISVSQEQAGPATAYAVSRVTVQFLTGANAGQTTTLLDESLSSSTAANYVPYVPGEKVILAQNTLGDFTGQQYYITDRFRLPALLFIILLFAAVAILFGRMRGFTSIIGLAISIGVLGWYVVPQILHGADPLTVCVIGAAFIAVASLYLAHGFSKRTTIALCGTLIALAVSALLAVLFVSVARLVGIPSDESFYLAVGAGLTINLRGILLGGIIIGALGVLDDVTIGQVATISEIKEANPNLDLKELYRRGMSVGREHIASLINTLFLAYAGVALPVILYLAAFQSQVPLWLSLNGEPIAEEIVRTAVGSIGIILAVPITTLLAAWNFGRKK